MHQYRAEIRLLKDCHKDSRQHRRGPKLDTGHSDAVRLRRKIRYRQNVNGKGDCAKENDNIPFVNGKSPAAHTQQIQSRDSDDNADPELYPRLLMQKQERTGTRMIYIAVINPAFPTVVY